MKPDSPPISASTRREFLKLAGLAGAAGVAGPGSVRAAERPPLSNLNRILEQSRIAYSQQFNMAGYAAPALETVRVGLIGVGNRGSSVAVTLSHIEGLELRALCDLESQRGKIDGVVKKIGGTRPAPEIYTRGEEDWKNLCARDDLDVVYICTPWNLHTPMAVYAMEHGKHAAVEVPAATTVEECWNLVETSERTRRHCRMLEEGCFGAFQLQTLNMAQQGFFGDIVHCEGAYLHHHVLEEEFDRGHYTNMWRLRENAARNGNLYPTHGLGPVAQIMNINRGDRMDYLVSTSSGDFMMGKMAVQKAAEDPFFNQFVGRKFRGNMNVTTIRTVHGRTIMLQHDVTSPRPFSTIYHITGTKAAATHFPLPGGISVAVEGDQWLPDAEYKKLESRYEPELLREVGAVAKKTGGHGGNDYALNWHFVHQLRHGQPLVHNVYDAALWSSISPLTEWSVANRSAPIDIPDFTNGKWISNPPVDMSLGLKG